MASAGCDNCMDRHDAVLAETKQSRIVANERLECGSISEMHYKTRWDLIKLTHAILCKNGNILIMGYKDGLIQGVVA